MNLQLTPDGRLRHLLTIDGLPRKLIEDLIDAAGLVEGEKVQVLNINNGERLETYVIKGERGSGIVSLNGPASRRAQVGDVVIVVAYGSMTIDEARSFRPTIIFPDEQTNKLKS